MMKFSRKSDILAQELNLSMRRSGVKGLFPTKLLCIIALIKAWIKASLNSNLKPLADCGRTTMVQAMRSVDPAQHCGDRYYCWSLLCSKRFGSLK